METAGMTAPAHDTSQTPSLNEVMSAVGSLADLMSIHGLTRLDLNVGSVAIRLRSAAGEDAPAQRDSGAEPAPAAEPPALVAEGHVLTAPMIGTYYASPAPGEPPFVRVGERIEVGQVIGIVEAMKIMNEIAADRAGTVQEILVQNAQAVEYGSPLMRLAE